MRYNKCIFTGVVLSSCLLLPACSGNMHLRERNAIVVEGKEAVAQYHETLRHTNNIVMDSGVAGKADFSQPGQRQMVERSMAMRPTQPSAGVAVLRRMREAADNAFEAVQALMPVQEQEQEQKK